MEISVEQRLENIEKMLATLIYGEDQSMPERKSSDVLTIEDVEKEYGLSEYQQRRARSSGKDGLAFILVGRHVRYRRTQVEKFLNKNTIK